MTARIHPQMSYEDVSALLTLDPNTGKLFWKVRSREMFYRECDFANWNKTRAGTEAICHVDKEGYRSGQLLGKFQIAHRIVWLLHTGEWPVHTIDHIDGNKLNNIPSNLRDVPMSVNNRNKGFRRASNGGVTGVCRRTGEAKWSAYIYDGGCVRLGRFLDFEEAVAARKRAEIQRGFHENHGRSA